MEQFITIEIMMIDPDRISVAEVLEISVYLASEQLEMMYNEIDN